MKMTIRYAQQRLVLCHLVIDLMRTVHVTYAPAHEPFGDRLETFFIAMCVAIGEIDGYPFSISKIADYMRVPQTTVLRGLDRLQKWGLIERQGDWYCANKKLLNSVIGMRSYQTVRRLVQDAVHDLSLLDQGG
jgi:hypothetical protein